MGNILENKREGLYCPAGDFYVDPRGKVERAVITHAHSDHARAGHSYYLCSDSCLPLLQIRIGSKAKIESVPFGKRTKIGSAYVSLHPAGHILGSAQIRIEVKGEVWVVSGDYKPQADQTCEAFEVVSCHGFISECTFGLPVYQWEDESVVHQEINHWWRKNAEKEYPSLLFAYSLGKAQRVLAGLEAGGRPVFVHRAIHSFLKHYEQAGVKFPKIHKVEQGIAYDFSNSLIIAPPAVEDSAWVRKMKKAKKGFASGWMSIRGAKRRRNVDRGFVLSDHADWPGLLEVIAGTGADRVLLTHGNGDALVRFLTEKGKDVSVLEGAIIRGEEEE
jgi:putative mRNA 3-end processing factor